MRLDEMIEVRIGKNLSRWSEKFESSFDAYSYENLISDLDGQFLDSLEMTQPRKVNNDSYSCDYGDVVFSFVSSKASIVSRKNHGKVINQNFAKLIFDSKQIDRHYICYVLNESPSIKRQMAIGMQGSTLPKMTPAVLKALEFTCPQIAIQKTIGEAYFLSRKRMALAKKEIELEQMLYLKVLNELDRQ